MPKLAFIGAGRMAGAMVRGLIQSGSYKPEEVSLRGGSGQTAQQLSAETGAKIVPDAASLLVDADAVVLACKPKQLALIAADYGEKVSGIPVISVLAGTPHNLLLTAFPKASAHIWAMPNTPAQMGQGMTGWSSLRPLSKEVKYLVDQILGGLGTVIEVKPEQMHAVTAVSGSGPAWLFAYAQACMNAAEDEGLDPEQSRISVLQTIRGALELLETTEKTPQALIDEVVSPGGTTEAGLEALKARDFGAILAACHQAASERSKQIADSASD